MRLAPILLLALVALSTLGCATSPQRAPVEQTVQQSVETPAAWATEPSSEANTPDKWLAGFNDPRLLKLIEEGKTNNRDLQVAAGNMDKAWLLAEQAGSSLKPTADLSVGATKSGTADSNATSSNISVNLQVSWELDVWGRIRSGVSAAEARAQAAQADYTFALHSLSANIAKSYFKAIDANLQAEIAQKNLSILEKTMRITQLKYDNGAASAQDVALNHANIAAAREQLITINASRRDALRALEVLLGRYPKAELDIPDILPDLPIPPPSGLPSEMLERRPDIVAAERQVAAAFDATDQARAARLPQFSLTGNLSAASNSLSDILNPANVVWQLASNLVAPLLDGGRRKIDIKIASVEQKQAVSNYAQKALVAFSEVETNLDQGQVLADRETAQAEVVNQSQKAFAIAELRYKEGESDLLDTLQIQQQLISAESNYLSLQRLQLEQRINLYLSLGGSW